MTVSRLACRQGGGVIDQHYYRYKGTPASISCVPLKSHTTSSAVASAASALDESSGCSTPCQGTPSSTIMHRPTAVTPARPFIYVLPRPRPANPMVSPYLNYTESPGAPPFDYSISPRAESGISPRNSPNRY